MSRLKILGLALMAVFALGALTSATAFGAIELLNEKHEKIENKLKITGHTATNQKLQILEGFAETKCPEILIETEQTSAQLGVFHFHWHKCTTSIGGTCTGLGDESGLILALGTYHLVEDKLGTLEEKTLHAGILFLVEHLHFACKTIIGTTLVLVLGDVLCLITPLTLSTEVKVNCTQGAKAGDPGDIVYWNEQGEEVKLGENGLLSSENEGTERMSAQVGEATGTATEPVELMD